MSNIKKLRKKAGLSRKVFASKIGVTAWNVRQWEKGKSRPRLGTLTKMADILECNLLDLTQ